ncbi:MAG: T9SS type A sorting domain-containing protein [Paludibacteraceae bacterium]|nr:T9SS type A sorting domain-containing protein [Paludibacteraceae bacterium]MBR5973193.1 T9SS type A sorting domain-containing protein [Paludibacteraceae bacterium]
MRKRILPLFIAFILSSFALQAEESVITVIKFDNTKQEEALSIVGKLTFSGDKMILYSKENAVLAESPLSEVRKIIFTGELNETKELAKNQVRIYPNPTQDQIILDGLTKGETVRIFSITGAVLKTVTAEEQTKIDVQSLAKGTYLLQVGTKVIKFIKE